MGFDVITKIGLVSAIVLPLWNIPLILKMIKRKSSEDISLYWAFGVWVCLLFMLPSGIVSDDIVWKVFNVVNFVLFTVVAGTVFIYRKRAH